MRNSKSWRGVLAIVRLKSGDGCLPGKYLADDCQTVPNKSLRWARGRGNRRQVGIAKRLKGTSVVSKTVGAAAICATTVGYSPETASVDCFMSPTT